MVVAWCGNSRLVARRHYLQVTEEHFEQAAQNPAQYPAGRGSSEQEATPKESPKNADLHKNTPQYETVLKGKMGGIGLEPTTSCVSSRTPQVSKQCHNNSLEIEPNPACSPTCTNYSESSEKHVSPLPDDLAEVMRAWSGLPKHIKQAVLALVRACTNMGE